MTTLVTGATGFIGRRVVHALLEVGAPVRAFVRPSTTPPSSWPEVARGDVTRAADVLAAMDGVTHVIHLAAIADGGGTRAQHQAVTLGGTLNVLASLPARAQLVFASSLVVYGDRLGRARCDESAPFGAPMGPYSAAKQQAERAVLESTAKVAVVRLTNVYGPGCGPWVREPTAQMRAGLPALVGGGRGRAALLHVDDAARLLLAAREATGVFNATGLDVSWRRYFTDLAASAGCRPPRSIPHPVARVGARVFDTLWRLLGRSDRPPISREAVNLVGSDLYIDGEKTMAELGWSPRVNYEAGLATIFRPGHASRLGVDHEHLEGRWPGNIEI